MAWKIAGEMDALRIRLCYRQIYLILSIMKVLEEKPQRNLDIDWESPLPGFRAVEFDRVEPDKNAYRFYRIIWQPTLFDAHAVIRFYGRIGQPKRMTANPFPSLEAAWPFIRALVKARLRHGYHITYLDIGDATQYQPLRI